MSKRLSGLVAALLLATAGSAFAQAESQEHETGGGAAHQNEALMEHAGESAQNPSEHGTDVRNEGQHGANAAHGQGAEGEHGGGAAEGHSVPEYIFHHVTDDFAYEFEVPLNEGHNPRIEFPRWRIAMPWGARACVPANEHVRGDVMEFANGCLDLTLSKFTVIMFLAAFILIVLVMAMSHRNQQKGLVPHGTSANIMEALVLFVRDELAVKNIGKEEASRYTPFLISVFFFILTMNLLGLLPWMATATGNIAVTVALALCTFFLTQYASIKAAGLGGFLKHLTGGVPMWMWPIMIPVEVLGLFTKPFALTVRLFANMVAGHVVIFFLLSLVFLLGSIALVPVGVAFAFAIYLLELFVAFLQAYVFTMLSALFIGMGVAMGHHGHDDHGDHGEHHEGGKAHDHGKAHQLSGS